MQRINNSAKFDFEEIPIDPLWNTGSEKELKIHRIHSYPAKFPAFITTKAIEYAHSIGLRVESIADIFCGCGTTAFEAKRNNIPFWGCDINPVATLIARVKSQKFQTELLEHYHLEITNEFKHRPIASTYDRANKRLQYWFKENHYNELHHLKTIILEKTSKRSEYQEFFLCAFSNILKQTSQWLAKSIKPQLDKTKAPSKVINAFDLQCQFMIKANIETNELSDALSSVNTTNILKMNDDLKVDMVITSPPYVTSYEYADLHQLSSLWLQYSEDFRELREGSIGSLHHSYNFNRQWKNLNSTGSKIVSLLFDQDKRTARSVAKYFLDMQQVAKKTHSLLQSNGIAVFVIGNTEYKNVRIDNTKHLAEALEDAGFSQIFASKRKIANKYLTPYRDDGGKFSTNSAGRKIYSEEFILIGTK
jgi:methylase of polypeptide subunit release factors